MNAVLRPDPPAPALDYIPITSIRPSMTQIQQLRRGHFNADRLIELAASIRTQGVLQPILVRPVKPEGTVKYEIVAGERRWIAADRAGLAHVPCIVRPLEDDQVLEAQLVENLQREDIGPIEEAEGYKELRRIKNYTADELAALIGKSKAYVYARLKLIDLCQEARAAVDNGLLEPSKALIVARLPNKKLQKKALELVSVNNWKGEPISYKAALEAVREKLTQDMAAAPFDFGMAYVGANLAHCPACDGCPSNSRNDAELQAALGTAHVCTDTACFERKTKIFWQGKRAAAEADGVTVLTGAAAKAAIPPRDTWCSNGLSSGYLELDAICDDMEFPEPEPKATGNTTADDEANYAWDARCQAWRAPTYRELLKDAKLTPVLAEDSHGQLHELVPIAEAQKLLKKQSIKLHVPTRQASMPAADNAAMKAERERQEERQRQETEYRTRVFQAIALKWSGPLKQPELAALAEELDYKMRHESLLALYPERKPFGQMKELELHKYLALFLAADCIDDYERPQFLFDLAKRVKVDADKLKQQIKAEAKAEATTRAATSAAAISAAKPARAGQVKAAAAKKPARKVKAKAAAPAKRKAAKK